MLDKGVQLPPPPPYHRWVSRKKHVEQGVQLSPPPTPSTLTIVGSVGRHKALWVHNNGDGLSAGSLYYRIPERKTGPLRHPSGITNDLQAFCPLSAGGFFCNAVMSFSHLKPGFRSSVSNSRSADVRLANTLLVKRVNADKTEITI